MEDSLTDGRNVATIRRAELPPLPPPLTPRAPEPVDSIERLSPTGMESLEGNVRQDAPLTTAVATNAPAAALAPPGGAVSASPKKSSDLRPILLALAALLVVGGIGYFVTQQLGGTSIVSDLESGECIENFFDSDEAGSFVEIFVVSTVDCSEPHAYEVFTTTAGLFPNDTYPGIQESFAIGQDFCLNEYVAFIGGGPENLSTWDVWTFVPPEDAWGGDRSVQCLVGDFEQTTRFEGTLQNAATR